jgi:hypothetical protein
MQDLTQCGELRFQAVVSRIARLFIFKPNPNFGTFLKPLEHFDIFYDHMVYFVAICFILWQFGICYGNSLYYPHFGILHQEKSGNPGRERPLS